MQGSFEDLPASGFLITHELKPSKATDPPKNDRTNLSMLFLLLLPVFDAEPAQILDDDAVNFLLFVHIAQKHIGRVRKLVYFVKIRCDILKLAFRLNSKQKRHARRCGAASSRR